MTKSVLFVAAALALTLTAASAADESGTAMTANYVLPGCQEFIARKIYTSQQGAFLQGTCWGMVYSIMFTASRLRSPPPVSENARSLCLDVVAGQATRVIVSYIEARPARMHESFYGLALEALRAAWPCRR
jgi:hypothetical protein